MPDIKYNFDKGYDNLSKISVPIKVLDHSFNQFLGNVKLSAYADFTSIKVTPDFNNADFVVSDNNYFIDFGDGTKSTELTASHTYKYPGSYNLTLVVTDSANNIFRSSDDKVVEVTNLIPDSIFLNYLSATDVEQHYSALSVDPIFLTRYNSKSMSQLLSTNNFKVDLSVEGNRMAFITEDQYNSNKNFHLEGCSFFANTRGKDFKVIDSVETDSTNIFAGISGGEIIIKTGKADDISNIFVGTSGFGTFYYYEDILEFDADSGVNSIFIEDPGEPEPIDEVEVVEPEPEPVDCPDVTVLIDSDLEYVIVDSDDKIEIHE
jgi:PKD repeat protein|tara:strand:- start:135 stop:1094 length:960 start_codon:yes stop_codon:yes gene_type:complete